MICLHQALLAAWRWRYRLTFSLCRVCDSVQVSRGSWFVKSPQIRRSRVTHETCSRLRRRSCAMSSARETSTSTPGTSWASTRTASSTSRTESETRSGSRQSPASFRAFDRSAQTNLLQVEGRERCHSRGGRRPHHERLHRGGQCVRRGGAR